jgi:nuclear transport factor 2 (NTF2) superfamily protein
MPVLTPQMREIVDWWKEYGIRNWETDDVHPMFRELMSKISELPTDEEEQYLFDIYRR